MSDIFQEVEEDVRRDQATEFLKRYGVYIAGGIAIIIAIVVGHQAWKYHELSQRQSAGAAFAAAEAAFAAGEVEAGLTQLTTIEQQGAAQAAILAVFRSAAALQEADRAEEAMARYDQAAVLAGSQLVLRDLALLKAAIIAMDLSEPADVRQRLSVLTVDGAPYRLSALELRAVLDIADGATDTALETLAMIATDGAATPSMVERAQLLLTQVGGTP